MKYILILITTFFCLTNVIAQEKNAITRRYIPIDEYKKIHDKELTKKDSLNLIIKDGITLVLIEEIKTSDIKDKSVPYEYKDDTFLEIYKKIAFNHKNDSFSENTQMKYWKEDIAIYFSTSIPKKTKKQFLKFANDVISNIDSLKIKEVKNVVKSNYVIYYSQDYEFEGRMTNYKDSNFWLSWRHNSLLYKNAIKIKTNKLFNEKLRLHKMKIFFIESLGYFKNNPELDCEHFFSGCYQEDPKLSEFDKEIIKYHYSFGICKGTTLEVFEKQHETAKKLLKETNSPMRFFHKYDVLTPIKQE